MNDPELLYFFGGFRSVSGITSPRGMHLDEVPTAMPGSHKVLKARNACVFFDPRSLDGPVVPRLERRRVGMAS